jgi:hypothetical protein
LTITASDARRRDFLLPRPRRLLPLPTIGFGGVPVMEEENLDWQRFEG